MGSRTGQRWRQWVLPEARRSVVSTVVAVLATAIIGSLWLIRDPGLQEHAAAVAAVVAWTIFTFVHLVLTRVAYGRLAEADLRVALVRDDRAGQDSRWLRLRHQLWDRWWRTDAPSWSVQVSVLALVVVAMIIAVPALRESQPLLMCALAMVAGSWANVVVMYAVHYARLDLRLAGLEFAGSDPRVFSDYAYLALTIQATFATSDVVVTTAAMRRTVMVQTGLAFVFNTVIIALIVSLLLGVAR
ncbi:DUF1345 domain-containing protein [Ruania alkalisoli]|uniref:DUF1345 domain-containing protein n=1 Tax=Ruania alkalisoli TaxID=2779775 RepID=A0A7M1SQV3_9MICO|nr:DUF1345 domain-containing protein [Ruania alkalisoli]QOR69940.1 DUF1345 domain-containing protein [Ruania alkalisoli]